jgi:hypothetical protein
MYWNLAEMWILWSANHHDFSVDAISISEGPIKDDNPLAKTQWPKTKMKLGVRVPFADVNLLSAEPPDYRWPTQL